MRAVTLFLGPRQQIPRLTSLGLPSRKAGFLGRTEYWQTTGSLNERRGPTAVGRSTRNPNQSPPTSASNHPTSKRRALADELMKRRLNINWADNRRQFALLRTGTTETGGTN